jgi:hypothetical protein
MFIFKHLACFCILKTFHFQKGGVGSAGSGAGGRLKSHPTNSIMRYWKEIPCKSKEENIQGEIAERAL